MGLCKIVGEGCPHELLIRYCNIVNMTNEVTVFTSWVDKLQSMYRYSVQVAMSTKEPNWKFVTNERIVAVIDQDGWGKSVGSMTHGIARFMVSDVDHALIEASMTDKHTPLWRLGESPASG